MISKFIENSPLGISAQSAPIPNILADLAPYIYMIMSGDMDISVCKSSTMNTSILEASATLLASSTITTRLLVAMV